MSPTRARSAVPVHSIGELDLPPTAGPAERRRFEQRIAYRERRAGVEQHRRRKLVSVHFAGRKTN
jgi:hypothetical protein